jgi:hypothetical protein
MRRWLIAALAWPLLVALMPPPLPAPPGRDQAGNWSLPFEPPRPFPARPDENSQPRSCTADRTWCAELSREHEGAPWRLDIFEGTAAPRRFELPGQDAGEFRFGLLPRLFRETGGAVLIAVERSRSTGFSGGGASATHVVLVRAEPVMGPVAEMLDVPYIGHATIRACFGERDRRARRDACHDEYELAGNFQLDLETTEGRPRFVLTAFARTWPGRRSRLEDSTAAPRLRRSDLVWAPDPGCTYRRILVFDPTAGRYLPDQPLPDCPDYFDF